MGNIPEPLAWAIYFAPLVGAGAIVAFLRSRPLDAGRVMIGCIGLSFVLSLWALSSVMGGDQAGEPIGFEPHHWFSIADLDVAFGIRLDGLTGVMLVVVTSVALLVQIYSTGYMHGDAGYARYFAYMGLFTTSMLGLVLASSLLQLFIHWELVGLCSYLLIGFWFHRPSAAAAAKKAFIVTRFGDFGFLLAVLLIWTETREFDIAFINEHAEDLTAGVAAAFTLGLFAGAVGKSAQFPLHIWLPDAMEGPTPVSALIHAATMVAAGVYLIARFFPSFEAAPPGVMTFVAYIGAITALMAATIGVVATDIKRVLAYSTISQLGYMVMALGLGGYVAALFHLFTHAFFKALLFLGSGSVNHASGTFDMRRMGGLREHMPWTFATFVIGALSLSGVFPLAGFWSKDEVLHVALEEDRFLFVIGAGVAFLTAFYMFRAIILTFLGSYRGGEPPEHGPTSPAHDGPHESPRSMVAPLVVLAVPAIGIGFVNVTGGFGHLIEGALPEALRHGHAEASTAVLVASTVAALSGIAFAFSVYYARMPAPETLRARLGPLSNVIERKYYMDEIAEGVLVRGFLYRGVARAAELFDTYVVDMAVNMVGWATRLGSEVARRTIFGQQQAYSGLLLAGVLGAVMVLFVLDGGLLERLRP
jgi:NADH-quinone oxidoreductase subunit L